MAFGSAVRSISVRLMAEVSNYVHGLQRAKAATGDLIDELSKSEQARQNFTRLGTGLVVAGAGIAAGLGVAANAAIDWETAWAGVLKTVDGSETQLAALEEQLRSMARELPQSHEEIAAVAEAAGQLGVATEDVADFTAVILDLGVATNLTSEEAAVAIARMANIMGTATSDVGKLGAALVDLGNNSATTEAEILQMALRIAGAGAIIGLSETDVLGFAAALSSVGIPAEAGGSAVSRAMVKIETSVREGGEELETLAAVAGMSADQFRRAYGQDAAQAIATFIAGLGRMQAGGEDVFGVIEQLGLSEQRTRDALLRLSASGDLLTRSLDTGADAWEENLALTEEAERRYDTTAARLQIARNQLNDFGIEMGEVFLPIIGDTADKLGSFVEFLGGLPEPIQNSIGILAAAGAVIALTGGAAIIAVPKIAAYRAALAQLQAQGGMTALAAGRVNSGIRGTMAVAGRAVGVLAALQIGSMALGAALDSDLNPQIEALTEGLARFSQTGQVSGELARVLGDDFKDLEEALQVLGPEGFGPGFGNSIKKGIEFVIPALSDMQGSMGRSTEQVEALDAALAGMVRGGRQQEAADAFARLAEVAEAQGVPIERLIELLPAYAGALEVAKSQSGETGGKIGQLGDTAGVVADKVDELKEAFDALFGVQMDIDRATLAYKQGLADLIDELEEGKRTLSLNSQAGRDNREAVLDQIEAIADLRQANVDNGMSLDEANGKYEKQLSKLEELLEERGFEEEAIRDIIDAYRDIPEQVNTALVLDTSQAQTQLGAFLSQAPRLSVAAQVMRHGGLVAAQSGLITSSPMVLFGERETGMEAFIPRDGISHTRGLALADTAARWHGGRVVAGDGAQLGGPFQWRGQRDPFANMAASRGGTTIGRQDVHVTTLNEVYDHRQVMKNLELNGAT